MVSTPAPDGRAGIDAALVERLIAAQFPQWSGLSVTPVEVDGWDNRTYRLGDDKTVRLPTAAGYVPAVAKENEWLPRLAPSLPVAVPPVLAKGEPGEGYPHPWSVRGWLPGETAARGHIDDMRRFAVSVAEFLLALHRCDTVGGPLAGEHSWYRGASPAHYDDETRQCLASLEGRVDTVRAAPVWDAALAAEWRGTPVWFHGDIAGGNLLVEDGRVHRLRPGAGSGEDEQGLPQRPAAGPRPGPVVLPDGLAERLPALPVEHSPGGHQVTGRVADARRAEVDDGRQLATAV